MRFMLLLYPEGHGATPAAAPGEAAAEALLKYNESLQRAGILLARDGLHPPSAGVRIGFLGGRARVIDGPFPEPKHTLGAYWIIQVRSKEEAIAWASRCPASEQQVIEVRQLRELSDVPPAIQELRKDTRPSRRSH